MEQASNDESVAVSDDCFVPGGNCEELVAAIAKTVADWPALTPEQAARLAILMRDGMTCTEGREP